jgi:hypothetical protein
MEIYVMIGLAVALFLQSPGPSPGPVPVPSEWIPLNNQTPLEASGPAQAVKIPVMAWDPDGDNPVAPDVSFSYSITASDKDTFRKTTNTGTSETQTFPQGVNLPCIQMQYLVHGGNTGYANGVFTWSLTGNGILVPPKPKKAGNFVPEIVPAEVYVNRHRAQDTVSVESLLKDETQTVNVTLTRVAYTVWTSEGNSTGG